MNAVGIPATPRSTANPEASSASASVALLLVSCSPSSGVSQMRSLSSVNNGACSVTKSSTDDNGMHPPPGRADREDIARVVAVTRYGYFHVA